MFDGARDLRGRAHAGCRRRARHRRAHRGRGGRASEPARRPGGELGIVSDDAFSPACTAARVMMVGGGYIGGGVRRHLRRAGRAGGRGLPPAPAAARLRRGPAGGLAEAMTAQGMRLHPGHDAAAWTPAPDGSRRCTCPDGTVLRDRPGVLRRRPRAAHARARAGARGRAHRGGRRGRRGRAGADQPAGIFAIGDVCNRLNLTPVAIAEGHALADRLFGPHRARLVLRGGADGGVHHPAAGHRSA